MVIRAIDVRWSRIPGRTFRISKGVMFSSSSTSFLILIAACSLMVSRDLLMEVLKT